MLKTKIFDVVFENPIKSYEVEAFRGAISKLVGYENISYHNHIGESKVNYAYPLIQYKIINGKASFSFIGKGVEDARAFFLRKNWEIEISGRKINLEVDTFSLRNALFDVSKKSEQYVLKNWMPLNQENFKKFIRLKSVDDKIKMLETILVGNVLSMGKTLNWIIEQKIEVSILEVLDERTVIFKKNNVKTFDIKFESNVMLPNDIGIGKGVSHGFGVIEKNRSNINSIWQ